MSKNEVTRKCQGQQKMGEKEETWKIKGDGTIKGQREDKEKVGKRGEVDRRKKKIRRHEKKRDSLCGLYCDGDWAQRWRKGSQKAMQPRDIRIESDCLDI